MQKILLVEDQKDFQLTVKTALGSRCETHTAETIRDASAYLERMRPDLILLDAVLPDGDGFQLLSRIRQKPEWRDIPVILLTGRSNVSDKVEGFSLGAEDYIVKPFDALEFRARVEAKLNSIRERQRTRPSITHGPLKLDMAMFRATVDEGGKARDLELTPHEFRLLYHLLIHPTEILSREQLMQAIWGDEVHVLDRTIDRHVSALRKKLNGATIEIESVHGVGYRLKKPKGD